MNNPIDICGSFCGDHNLCYFIQKLGLDKVDNLNISDTDERMQKMHIFFYFLIIPSILNFFHNNWNNGLISTFDKRLNNV